MTRVCFLLLMLLPGWHLLHAQQMFHPDTQAVFLTTGPIFPGKNISTYNERKTAGEFIPIEGYFHLVLQFNEIPGQAALSLIRENGILLSGYLPNKAFFAAVPVATGQELLESLDVCAVICLKGYEKTDPLLRRSPLPEWIESKQTMRAYIHCYAGISSAYCLRLLSGNGIRILQPHPRNGIIEASFPSSQLEALAMLPFIQYIAAPSAPGFAENDQSRTNQRSNTLLGEPGYGLQYDGKGVRIMLDDDGDIGAHIDYKNRVDQSEATDLPLFNDHADMIAGTLAGAGNLDPRYKGMAPGATISVYTYTSNIASDSALFSFPGAYINDNIVLTNTSQSNGCNSGYTAFAQVMDQQTRDHASLLHVFSAGNNGASDCGYGAGPGWGNITGGSKLAKNVLSVGNVIKNDILSPSSSRGPASDGRIKPELVSTGVNIMSTTDNPSENTYDIQSGSSFAAPGVTGILAQLYEASSGFHGDTLPGSALIKAIVLNTADDLGNTGPDFTFGYGRINGRRAFQVLADTAFFPGNISNGNIQQAYITVPAGVKELRVLLYWHDVPATVNANPSLVNNLDLLVTDPMAANWFPWVLNAAPNAATLDDNAVRQPDFINNIEQVTIPDPAAGTYMLSVAGTLVPQGPQAYVVVYEYLYDSVTVTYPLGGEGLAAGETVRVRWDSYGNATDPFTLDYSADGGSSWINAATGIGSGIRFYDWTTPTLISGKMLVRISRGTISDRSDTAFSVIGVPQNLRVDSACDSSVTISWDAVTGATAYEVFMLDSLYMLPVDTVMGTSYTFQQVDISEDNWFSARTFGQLEAKGRRAVAIRQEAVSIDCFTTNGSAMPGNGISVYPNPFTTKIMVDQLPDAGFRLVLTDLHGRVLQSATHAGGEKNMSFDLSHLQDGVYLLKISSAEKEYIQKLVKTE